MNKVKREDIVDYVTWGKRRKEELPTILADKKNRRIHLGELTFLFENADTMRYQVQEMMRVEQIVEEAAIMHEIETYNEVLPNAGGLGCSLLIEIDDPDVRDRRLAEMLGLPEHLYLLLQDGSRVYATFDLRQIGDDRLSSVQYLQFDVKGKTPVAIGADHPALTIERILSADQQSALANDLSN